MFPSVRDVVGIRPHRGSALHFRTGDSEARDVDFRAKCAAVTPAFQVHNGPETHPLGSSSSFDPDDQ